MSVLRNSKLSYAVITYVLNPRDFIQVACYRIYDLRILLKKKIIKNWSFYRLWHQISKIYAANLVKASPLKIVGKGNLWQKEKFLPYFNYVVHPYDECTREREGSDFLETNPELIARLEKPVTHFGP
ncbi:hypothetical protein CEXT_387381 [Caerostris extrusa]|uniref:Uncharacterized protein n=1 Tax=Caerostris extrusa TaxID=172846 RepID=A0AAV4Y6U6_CAEEX|nr:hypothetical protein CEXT_387381 [Caerostris extrusa]